MKVTRGRSHPNRLPFTAVAMFVDTVSDNPLTGARGHRVIFPRNAVKNALPGFVGMAINSRKDGCGHDPQRKIGIITWAWLCGDEVLINGHVFAADFPEVAPELSEPGFGISIEAKNVYVEDMKAEVWRALRLDFSGAAVCKAEGAAFQKTSFQLLQIPTTEEKHAISNSVSNRVVVPASWFTT
jgi:hypothetical protein